MCIIFALFESILGLQVLKVTNESRCTLGISGDNRISIGEDEEEEEEEDVASLNNGIGN